MIIEVGAAIGVGTVVLGTAALAVAVLVYRRRHSGGTRASNSSRSKGSSAKRKGDGKGGSKRRGAKKSGSGAKYGRVSTQSAELLRGDNWGELLERV